MMAVPDVRIFNRSMELVGFASGITSLQWHRKYNATGSFELHCSPGCLQYMMMDGIVWLKDAAEAGVIETIKLTRSTSKDELVVKGRFLDSYMDRRLVKGTYNVSDKSVTEAMQECFINATSLGDYIAIGSVTTDTTTTTFQADYKSLLEVEQSLAQTAGLGIRFRPDFNAKKIYFDIYKGIDRSDAQPERSRVIFAPMFQNVENAEREQSSIIIKTVCYVAGSGAGDARTIVEAGDDTLTGLDRRETFLTASDVTKTSSMSDTDYQAALKERGTKELAGDVESDTFNADVEPNANFRYKTDYDLGDTVSIIYPDWGIEVAKQITEISEVYERGTLKIKTTFGTDYILQSIGGKL